MNIVEEIGEQDPALPENEADDSGAARHRHLQKQILCVKIWIGTDHHRRSDTVWNCPGPGRESDPAAPPAPAALSGGTLRIRPRFFLWEWASYICTITMGRKNASPAV